MPDKRVTSHNQKGGITADTVNMGERRQSGRFPDWAKWTGLFVTMVGVIGMIVFGILQLGGN